MPVNPLNILVVLPLYGGSLPIGRYCAMALKKMGHNVRIFESPVFYSSFSGLKELDIAPDRTNILENSFLRVVSQGIFLMAQEQKSQIVLAMAQAPLDRIALQKMRNEGMRTIMWFVEDYQLFQYWRYYAPLYDAFAVIQKEPFLSELAKTGQKNAFYLPLAAEPDFHKHLELNQEEKETYGSEISFMGAGYPNRRLAFRPLAGKNFKIWGSDWEGEKFLTKNIQREGKRIPEDESVKIYNATQINLNLHSSIKTDNLVGNGDFVNPRTFELASMGAFQLVDRRSLMSELFSDNELAIFNNLEEMYSMIDYFLKNPQKRQEYINAARKRILKDHTYEQRMASLIGFMEKTFGPFESGKENNELLKDLPENFRKKLENFIHAKNLPDNATFKEVVEKIRQENGELTEIETAILFLDEWRKQYR